MTEDKWLHGTEPGPMLMFVQGNASERKMRLFVVACARLVWDQIEDPTMRRGIETAEQYADGLVSYEELDTSHMEVYRVHRYEPAGSFGGCFGLSLACGFSEIGLKTIVGMNTWRDATRLTGHCQPSFLREIFGNPFRPVAVSPHWMTLTVKKLADTIYEEK